MATRIYTRTGDAGETGLFGGRRVGKEDLRIEAYGTVDELNSVLGVAVASAEDAAIARLLAKAQSDLFVLGADLASPEADLGGHTTIPRVTAEHARWIEQAIDAMEEELPPLTQFVLPGGTMSSAMLHMARAVCRRAERRCVALARREDVNPEALRYLNRLSDLLFVAARAANRRAGVADVIWRQEHAG